MRASTAVVDITPHGTFYMEGYAHEVRHSPAVGVHDAPLAVLLLLEGDGGEALFVSLDVCIVSERGSRLLREGLRASLGLPDERIVISAIHSHSCANGFEGGEAIVSERSHGYVEMASGRVIEASTRLREGLVEVVPELLTTHVRGWYGNRNDRDRPFDDAAHVLRFRTGDGGVAGAMLNFNCHATVVGPLNRLLTTDVIGGVRNLVADWVGVVPYAFTGASADLGNRQYRQGNDFAELARVSCGIAAQIMQGEFESVDMTGPRVGTFVRRVEYDNAQYYPQYRAQLEEASARLEGEISFDERKLAETEVQLLRRQLEVGEVSFELAMRTLDFGGVVLVTFPGELASDLGALVKGMFPGRAAIIIGYANDYQGYFVPEGDFGGSSYESYVTKMPKGGIEQVLAEFEESL